MTGSLAESIKRFGKHRSGEVAPSTLNGTGVCIVCVLVVLLSVLVQYCRVVLFVRIW